jgi:uncharacterized protein
MAYLIDGHNLIGQLPDISLSDPHDEAKLVLKLIGFAARTQKRCIVIFDHGIPGGKSPLSNGTVEVVFASQGVTADAIMKKRIREARDMHMWVVVSNDNEVLDAARARKMKAMKSAEFAPLLQPTRTPKKDAPQRGREAMDVHVTPREVEEWLKIFGDGKKKKP